MSLYSLYLASVFLGVASISSGYFKILRVPYLNFCYLSIFFSFMFLIFRPWGAGRDDFGYDQLFINPSYTEVSYLWIFLIKSLNGVGLPAESLRFVVAFLFIIKCLIFLKKFRNYNFVILSYVTIFLPLHDFVQLRFAIASLGIIVFFIYAIERRLLVSSMGFIFAFLFHLQTIFFAPFLVFLTLISKANIRIFILFFFICAIIVFYSVYSDTGEVFFRSAVARLNSYKVLSDINDAAYPFPSPIVLVITFIFSLYYIYKSRFLVVKIEIIYFLSSILTMLSFVGIDDVFVRLHQMFLLPQIFLLSRSGSSMDKSLIVLFSFMYFFKHNFSSNLFLGL